MQLLNTQLRVPALKIAHRPLSCSDLLWLGAAMTVPRLRGWKQWANVTSLQCWAEGGDPLAEGGDEVQEAECCLEVGH